MLLWGQLCLLFGCALRWFLIMSSSLVSSFFRQRFAVRRSVSKAAQPFHRGSGGGVLQEEAGPSQTRQRGGTAYSLTSGTDTVWYLYWSSERSNHNLTEPWFRANVASLPPAFLLQSGQTESEHSEPAQRRNGRNAQKGPSVKPTLFYFISFFSIWWLTRGDTVHLQYVTVC